ncbi:MAG TPA: hypothetical protein VFE18_02210 [Phenylobacterium sp.]|jgi:hypothetical protein|uniref:hypothetical protein n=1 Tax=Phenylobacterium sp. TaxID=1871053 RepID=UPI002D308CBA|nr:hypothetical protein [Phenylobacterium sp.]HZZ66962.1 hypothetical protein [Phenylobacterium sp.]
MRWWLALATLCAAAVPAITDADPPMSWVYIAPLTPESQSARLAYGVPATEDGLISMDCRRGSGRLTIMTWAYPAPKGVVADLAAGGARSRPTAKVEPNDIAEGAQISIPLSSRDPVMAAFRQGAPLSVRLGKTVTRLPRVDPAAAADFFRFCG